MFERAHTWAVTGYGRRAGLGLSGGCDTRMLCAAGR